MENKDTIFVVGFIVLIIVGGLSSAARDEKAAKTTATSTTPGVVTSAAAKNETIQKPSATTASKPAPTKTDAQINKEITQIYKELDELEEELRVARLREPISPYAGKIELNRGTAKTFDRTKEYLTLTATKNNIYDITITGWTLESYVTGVRATIPIGIPPSADGLAVGGSAIQLRPGEIAYVQSGYSPAGFSFQESICTGYLASEGTFSPALKSSCPLPLDEFGRFGTELRTDRDCRDYISTLKRCAVSESDDLRDADLSRSCRSFIQSTLTYSDCIDLHRNDPAFSLTGAWRIFLRQRGEIWRSEREIIRLLDADGRVVDYIEY